MLYRIFILLDSSGMVFSEPEGFFFFFNVAWNSLQKDEIKLFQGSVFVIIPDLANLDIKWVKFTHQSTSGHWQEP